MNRRQFTSKALAGLALIPLVLRTAFADNRVGSHHKKALVIKVKHAKPGTVLSHGGEQDFTTRSFENSPLHGTQIYVLKADRPNQSAPKYNKKNFGKAMLIAFVLPKTNNYKWYGWEPEHAYRIWLVGVDIYDNSEIHGKNNSCATKVLTV